MTKEIRLPEGGRTGDGRGPFKYRDYRDNHVVIPGAEAELEAFVNQTYGGMQHKLANARSSNSEDALTWSCFDALAQLPDDLRQQALAELWQLAFDGARIPPAVAAGNIFVGQTYGHRNRPTEVDASIEGDGALVFVEAKLYSPMSMSDDEKDIPDEEREKPYDQIINKLRVGLLEAGTASQFYFILLDLAPIDKLTAIRPGTSLNDAELARPAGFGSKWLTGYWFRRYKSREGGSITPLRKALTKACPNLEIDDERARQVAKNMGWLTWADLFKIVLRGAVNDRASVAPLGRRRQIVSEKTR